ncbi:hypothetical protein [Pseudooceanicola sp.]
MFGIFSEKIVDVWARDTRAPYVGLGRPTLRFPGDVRGHTLDFTLLHRNSELIFAAEMKCEIEYMNFRYFVLESAQQLDHHSKPAFEAFLKAAKTPELAAAKVARKPIRIDGAILVWGAIDADAVEQIKQEVGFYDILSIEEICRDLATWENKEYLDLIEQYRSWSNRLFDGLITGTS